MSRLYSLTVMARGLTTPQINGVLVDAFGWDLNIDSERHGNVECNYHGSLGAGQSEESAHAEIYAALKAINPDAKIRTRFTYLEDLPYEEYGDDLERRIR